MPIPTSTSPASPRLWDYKPWWCQPWSIVLTGTLLVSGVWWLTRSLWLTLPVGGAIAMWWLVFLILVPRAFRLQSESSRVQASAAPNAERVQP